MIKNFRTYEIAVKFYHQAALADVPGHLKNQLLRAASSIALNLAEGGGRNTKLDQKRFFTIAMGSLRECQAVLDLAPDKTQSLAVLADSLGASLYCLIRS